jgi:hypothetical protein
MKSYIQISMSLWAGNNGDFPMGVKEEMVGSWSIEVRQA